jgi:osmotically-inducible protein OsmY
MMVKRPIVVVALCMLFPLLPACVPLAVTGVGAAALMATDRRTGGVYIEDQNIELKALGVLHGYATAHVNATSYNLTVLLTGEVPDAAAKKQIVDGVRAIASVKNVVDETQVSGVSSMASRGNDSLVTSNVKTRMLNNKVFNATQVKVVTEAGVVYLMGLVTRAEGDEAVFVTRNTSGVTRVVPLFEYIAPAS